MNLSPVCEGDVFAPNKFNKARDEYLSYSRWGVFWIKLFIYSFDLILEYINFSGKHNLFKKKTVQIVLALSLFHLLHFEHILLAFIATRIVNYVLHLCLSSNIWMT